MSVSIGYQTINSQYLFRREPSIPFRYQIKPVGDIGEPPIVAGPLFDAVVAESGQK